MEESSSRPEHKSHREEATRACDSYSTVTFYWDESTKGPSITKYPLPQRYFKRELGDDNLTSLIFFAKSFH